MLVGKISVLRPRLLLPPRLLSELLLVFCAANDGESSERTLLECEGDLLLPAPPPDESKVEGIHYKRNSKCLNQMGDKLWPTGRLDRPEISWWAVYQILH